MKRLFDISLALLLLPFSLVLILICSIILLIELREFPFFLQKRGISLDNKTFTLIKLKTIKSNVSSKTGTERGKNILVKPNLKQYITPFAKLLKQTGLDELPQIFNIISGKMSFVGPRPLMLEELSEIKKNYSELYKIRDAIKAKPGLTGLWQIFCDRDEGVRNLVALDKIYDETNNFIFDLKILFFTIPIVLTGSNTDSIVQKKQTIIVNLFNISNSTRFSLYQKLKIFDKKNSNYVVEIPGDWWYKTSSVKTKVKPHQLQIKTHKRKNNHS